eukprot:g7444.t1
MFSDEQTSTQALLEAGPSSGSRQPTIFESDLTDIVVDNPSDVLHASALPSSVAKPRPLNLADDCEIVGGVQTFVLRREPDRAWGYAPVGLSSDGSRIALATAITTVGVYDLLHGCSLIAKKEDTCTGKICFLSFLDNRNDQLVVLDELDQRVYFYSIIDYSSTSDEYAMSKIGKPKELKEEQVYSIDRYFDFLIDVFADTSTLWTAWKEYYRHSLQVTHITREQCQHVKLYAPPIIHNRFGKIRVRTNIASFEYELNELSDMYQTVLFTQINFENKSMPAKTNVIEGRCIALNGLGQNMLFWNSDRDGQSQLNLYSKDPARLDASKPITSFNLGNGVMNVLATFLNRQTWIFNDKSEYRPYQLPLICVLRVQQSNADVLVWDADLDKVLTRIDVPIKEVDYTSYSRFELSASPDGKWFAILDGKNCTIHLFSSFFGVQVWQTSLDMSPFEANRFMPLSFNALSTTLVVNCPNKVYVLCPPSLVEDYLSDFQSATYDLRDFKEQKISLKSWHKCRIPKHILKQMLFLYHGLKSNNIEEILDVSGSKITSMITLLIHKDDALNILQGPFEKFFTSLFQEHIKSNWSQDTLPSGILELEVEKTRMNQFRSSYMHKSAWMFLYPNEEKNEDLIALFLDQDELLGVFINTNSMYSQEQVPFSVETCFAIKQSNNRNKVSCLFAYGVMVIDLNKRIALYSVHYNIDLYTCLVPYMTKRGENCFDVLSNGEAILVGWDIKNVKMFTLTSTMTEDQFKTMFEDEDIITPIHLFGEAYKAVAFLEFNANNRKVLSICIHYISGNATKRITREQWNPQITRALDSMTHKDLQEYTLCFDEDNGQLWIIGLIQRDTTCDLIFLPIKQYSNKGSTPSLYMLGYPRREIVELEELISQFGLSFFNMKFNGKTNFQLAFENKDKVLMMKLLHYGNQHGLALNDMFAESFEEFSNNFLKLAIRNKNEVGVALFFDLLEKKTFPFEQGASLLKDEFSNLWMHFRSMLEPRIMSNNFERQVCDIQIPIEVVSRRAEARMGTINSMDDWEHAANQGTITTYYKSLHVEALDHITKKGSNATTTATVVVFTIASMCKIGLNGIIRPLLMQDAPSHVFGSSLLQWTVDYKWKKIWNKRSWKSLMFYSVYMLVYSIYSIWMTLSRKHLDHDMVLCVCLSILLLVLMVFTSILLYLEYIQIKSYIQDEKKLFPNDRMWGLRKYWSSGWNIVEIVSYIMVLIVIPSLHVANLLNFDVWSILSACIAVESILIWIKVWYFAQAFEKTGAFVLMIENIIKDCVSFLGLALVILLGFSFAMFILFQQALHEKKSIDNEDDDNEDDYNETRDTIEQSFGDPWKAIVTMFYAMIGTFELEIYQDSGSLSILITIMFVFYLAMQMIVMVNMLIAIMGDTFDRVKSTEEEQLLMRRARFIDACEAQLSEKDIEAIESSIGKYLYVLLPKDEYVTDDIRLWQGRVKTIEDRVGKMIRDSEIKVLKRIEENNKEMKDGLEVVKGEMSKLSEMNDSLEKVKDDMSEIKQVKDSLKKVKDDISELKEMKSNLEKVKGDITKLEEIKEDNERMKEDINEIKQMLRNIIARDGE